ncbi:MAG: hypothetical protein B7Y70_07480 [Rhizobiales bacterium 35-68-8]|nr:MAG: hypothetical protein B7Y70_07480 [Rhizobiales bacterium 35-68-8]
MNRFKLMAGALVALSLIAATGAQAQTCLEQIVALQARVKAVSPDPKPPTEAQSVGAQLDRQPTPASIAAASGGTPAQCSAEFPGRRRRGLLPQGRERGARHAGRQVRTGRKVSAYSRSRRA